MSAVVIVTLPPISYNWISRLSTRKRLRPRPQRSGLLSTQTAPPKTPNLPTYSTGSAILTRSLLPGSRMPQTAISASGSGTAKTAGLFRTGWRRALAQQTIQTLWLAHSDDETRGRQFSATITALIEIGPKDEIEGMIAAQLIAAHNATMECYRRAMIGDQTLEGRRDNLSQANKLSRTYAVLLDALNRHRGKGGQQKVTVEHVDVHAGGQAVVGLVESPRGGDQPKSEDQARAKQIGHAPQPAVWSADKERQPLPVSGDAERPLPNARRDVPGRPEV